MDSHNYNEMLGMKKEIQDEYQAFEDFFSSSLNRFTIQQEGEPSFLFSLLKRRVFHGNPVLKAYFTRKIYDYIKLKSIEEEADALFSRVLPFGIEALMAIQYYDNQILDRKGRVTTPALINNNLILSHLLQQNLLEYLETRLPGSAFNLVARDFRLILKIVDIGQLTEKQNNLFSNYRGNTYGLQWNEKVCEYIDDMVLQEVKDIILNIAPELNGSTFLDWYLRRIYFTGAFIYPQFVKLIAKLLGEEATNHRSLVHFSGLYGMFLQIVNDLTDFIPSDESAQSVVKNQTDAFSDMNTKNITLPLLIHLEQQKDGSVRNYLENKETRLTREEEWTVLKSLISSGSVDKTRKIIVNLCTALKKLLDKENKNYPLFANMCDFAYSNKFENFYGRYLRRNSRKSFE